jgi:hypothetical protein
MPCTISTTLYIDLLPLWVMSKVNADNIACDSVKSEISVKKIIAHVDPDLRELILSYLQNRHKDIKAIDAAL